jgi:hypothetical protein
MAATTAGASSKNELKVKGSRSNSTNYYVDGVRVGTPARECAKPVPAKAEKKGNNTPIQQRL